jgi:hypothetical protein
VASGVGVPTTAAGVATAAPVEGATGVTTVAGAADRVGTAVAGAAVAAEVGGWVGAATSGVFGGGWGVPAGRPAATAWGVRPASGGRSMALSVNATRVAIVSINAARVDGAWRGW